MRTRGWLGRRAWQGLRSYGLPETAARMSFWASSPPNTQVNVEASFHMRSRLIMKGTPVSADLIRCG